MDKFCSEILRRSVHQALASAGFEKSSKLGGEVFADVLKDYLLCLGKSAHEGAIRSGRTKTTSTDVLAAFEDFGIRIDELKEWSQTDGKILGKYTGPLPQPKIMEGLLRSGLPGYSTNEFSDLPTTEIKEASDFKSNVNPVDSNEMQVDTIRKSHEIIFNEVVDKNNEPEDSKGLQIEATNEHLVDSSVVLQSYTRPLRPSYVPEWLPPFPEVKPQQDERLEYETDDALKKSPEISSNEAISQDTTLEIHKDDENSVKSNLVSCQDKSLKTTRRKRSLDQRPPTYDIANVFNSIAPPKVQTQELSFESSFESPKKKRKLKIIPSSLIPFHAVGEISQDGIANQDVTSLTKLMSSTVGPLKLLKESQTKKPSIATRTRSDNEIHVTNISSLSEIKQPQVKLPVSRKGKEKMVDASDFRETTPLNSSRPRPPTAIRRGSKVKLGKSITKPVIVPADKPASASTTGATKLRIRLGKVSPIDVVAPAASPVASTSSVQSQLVVNNPSNVGVADPPEVINCICPYPFSEIDDGNFMLSCDGCQVWFHGICTGFGPSYVEVDTWYCERCRARGVGIS
ncbi:7339_t:CDS:2 [Cetraspora pellucida]|uniref:7339_t:CDS:1 n=1 Tax=Cetraspora pellucida TaxID=1433469 RepID=A0A9N8ZLJ4_9GLOM|nr:7339_t:CDS:2 [Cetraspora pellucida]